MNRMSDDRFNECALGLDALRDDMKYSQRAGLPFIMASVVIWALITVAAGLNIPVVMSNMIIFCCACPLMPLAMLAGKIVKVDLFDKKNVLWKAGVLFTCNQFIYILIAMWAVSCAPQYMLMIYAMIFGAHFLPYSWLYKSKAYLVSSLVIPVLSLALGLYAPRYVLAAVLMCFELAFAFVLYRTTRE